MSRPKTYRPRRPLHQQIADRLRREVAAQYRRGDKFGSQNQLARRFSVSALTVREAVATLVQEGVLERRHGSGTFVSNPRGNHAVGVLIEQDISCPGTSPYWLTVIQETRRQLSDAGYLSRLYAGHTRQGDPAPELPTCAEFWEDLQQQRLRALITIGTSIRQAFRGQLKRFGVPLLAPVDLYPEDMHDQMLADGTKYLIDQGCQRIAVACWGHNGPDHTENTGFLGAMAARGHGVVPELIYQAGNVPSPSAGRMALKALWCDQDMKPDGVLVTSDILLPSFADAIMEFNIRTPEQLLVVAHTQKGAYTPPFPICELQSDPQFHAQTLVSALRELEQGQRPRRRANQGFYRLVHSQLDKQAQPAL